MEQHRSYRYRLCPTPTQTILLTKTAGCCRWVYNQALATREQLYGENGKAPSINDLIKILPKWKQENPWLAEVSSNALQQTILNLGAAYERFFQRNAAHPRFKSKRRDRPSFRVPQQRKGGWRAIRTRRLSRK